MRDLAAQERHVQQSRQFDVVNKQGLAGEKPAVFIAFDGFAECAGRHSRQPRIRSAAAITASTMFWYPVQRHRFPDSASRTSSSLGERFSSRKAVMVMRMPGVQ